MNMTAGSDFAIIGGSGLYSLTGDEDLRVELIQTPWAENPIVVHLEATPAGPVWFLPRHGKSHNVPPHKINYRANLWALREVGATKVIAVNAVGGISETMQPSQMVVPDQLIDYTWGREHTYFDGLTSLDNHIDFTHPYDHALGKALMAACVAEGLPVVGSAVYGCTQGPRLETAAEVRKLARDGCDIVGMTGMPEAALARELGLDYACLALVVNRAAGLGADLITVDQIEAVLLHGVSDVRRVLQRFLSL